MDHTDFCRVLFRRLDAEIAGKMVPLVAGASQTIEGYREQVGVIRGLRTAREMVHAMLSDDERLEISLRS